MRGSPVRVRLSALYGAKSQSDLALLLLRSFRASKCRKFTLCRAQPKMPKSKFAELAQLVEHWLPKPRVAGSSPVFRSKSPHKHNKNLVRSVISNDDV